MDYTLTEGNASNYQVVVNFTEEDLTTARDGVLTELQKDMELPGFRKGHVPLEEVVKNINPEHVAIGVYEKIINSGMQKIIADKPDMKFVGEIYDLQVPEEETMAITFTIDVYPTISVNNENWRAVQLVNIDETTTDEEKKNTMNVLKRQHASYESIEEIGDDELVVRLAWSYIDANDGELSKKRGMIGDHEFQQDANLKTLFFGKKRSDTIDIAYEDDMPAFFAFAPKEDEEIPAIHHVHVEIVDVQKVVLPEFTDENIQHYFGEEITSVAMLEEKILGVLGNEKRKKLLGENMQKLVDQAKESFAFVLPKSMIKEEFAARKKKFVEAVGGEEKYDDYIASIKETVESMDEKLEGMSRDALNSFFLLHEIAQQLDVMKDVDMEKDSDMEEKIYAAFMAQQ